MKKKIYIVVAIIVLALAGYSFLNKTGVDVPKGKMITGSPIETFSGTIQAVNTGCYSDGICSITVDGKEVIVVRGGRGLPPDTKVGKLIGVESIGDVENKIGDHANVYATTTTDGKWSLYGNNDYYIEVLKLKNK